MSDTGDLRELYQEVIFDHNRHPRNFGRLADANRMAEGHNPLCGDNVTVYLKLEGDRVADVKFEGQGCAISTASASLMSEAVKGRSVEEVERLFHSFHAMIVEDNAVPEDLGKLEVLAGVKEFPVRVKCATLPWHTLHNALLGRHEAATTE